MANCEDFTITVMNNTHAEVKMTKFEYKDGSKWKTENFLGLDGYQCPSGNRSRDLNGL